MDEDEVEPHPGVESCQPSGLSLWWQGQGRAEGCLGPGLPCRGGTHQEKGLRGQLARLGQGIREYPA